MIIPFNDLSSTPIQLKIEWKDAIAKVLQKSNYINGEEVSDFEAEWSNYIGSKTSVGVGNGLDALVISLLVLGIGTGKFVGVPCHTFIATFLAVERTGAKVVPLEVNENGLLDVNKLKNSNHKLDAVIPVHMHGNLVDMHNLNDWARKNNIYVIEDASQAHGASIGGKKAGSLSDISAFSLYPTKNLGAIGDAGIISTNNAEWASVARSIANYGTEHNKYNHVRSGINSRLDSIQAAVLKCNLVKLDEFNEKRKKIAQVYKSACEKNSISYVDGIGNVWHHFILIVNNRDSIRDYFLKKGISTEIHYPRLASSEFAKIKKISFPEFPIGNYFSEKCLSIPMHPFLKDTEIEHIKRVIEGIENGTST